MMKLVEVGWERKKKKKKKSNVCTCDDVDMK